MEEPKIITTYSNLDLELSELLGEQPSRFLMLCLDGRVLEGYGTPYDTPASRAIIERLVVGLNDRSTESWWPAFFDNWKPEIKTQFGLKEDCLPSEFQPLVSWEIHRTCCGHSSFLHCAIRLFEEEQVSQLIKTWLVAIDCEGGCVKINSKSGEYYEESSKEPLAILIGRAVKRLLLDNK